MRTHGHGIEIRLTHAFTSMSPFCVNARATSICSSGNVRHSWFYRAEC